MCGRDPDRPSRLISGHVQMVGGSQCSSREAKLLIRHSFVVLWARSGLGQSEAATISCAALWLHKSSGACLSSPSEALLTRPAWASDSFQMGSGAVLTEVCPGMERACGCSCAVRPKAPEIPSLQGPRSLTSCVGITFLPLCQWGLQAPEWSQSVCLFSVS